MNYEEKIKELTQRIEKLEKAENKRIVKNRIKIILKTLKIIIIIIGLYLGYQYINKNYIEPYKEKIELIGGKLGTVESFIDNNWQNIQNLISPDKK